MCQTQIQYLPVNPIKSPSSPWRRLLRQPVRPKLPRNIATGARINLNRYWSKFEEVTTLHFLNLRMGSPPTDGGVTDDNAINDNLANERTEFGNAH